MELELIKGWTGTSELISDKPTEPLVAKLVKSLDWQQFHSITLKIDDQNWVNVSGNQANDGLALVYEESGESTVSDFEPKTTEDLIEILQLYLRSDQRYKKLRPQTFSHSKISQHHSDDEAWRAKYDAKGKIGKRYQIISFVAAVLVIGAIASILYLWSKDELKFVGHTTDHTTAIVTETRFTHGATELTQIVIYEFEYGGEKYWGYFKGKPHYRKHEVDDLLKIKFSKDDPSVSKRIATYKRNY